MLVGVAVFELHIEAAQSLKEKRTVVRSLRDRIRRKFEISVAEVGLNDLHQRARIGVAAVSGDGRTLEKLFEAVLDLVESIGDARLLGWRQELIEYGDEGPMELPEPLLTPESFQTDEEDQKNDTDR